MWYHKVKQTSGKEGFACAVNYWYDMSFEGGFWASNSFVRDVASTKGKDVQYPALDLNGER
jgi:jumonji domain-containing protein 7